MAIPPAPRRSVAAPSIPLTRALGVVAALLAAAVLVQAVLAGQALFGSSGFDVHGYVGNASFALGLVVAVLAFLARVPGWQFALSVALLSLLFAQTGLGYVGRESTTAAAWHVPLGVTIFGLALLQVTAAVGTLRRPPA